MKFIIICLIDHSSSSKFWIWYQIKFHLVDNFLLRFWVLNEQTIGSCLIEEKMYILGGENEKTDETFDLR